MSIDLGTALTVFCSITALMVSLGTIIDRLRKPAQTMEMRLADFGSRLSEVEQAQREDRRELNRLIRLISLQTESVATLMDHEIDGNNTEQLKACSRKIKSELYNFGGLRDDD